MSNTAITKYFRLFNADQFHKQLTDYGDDSLYLFLGGIIPWDDENVPPDVNDTIESNDIDLWREMFGLKKFTSGDASFSVPRYDWSAGTVYTQYSSDSQFYNEGPFYVVTDLYNVYICLDNNKDAVSSIKPTGTSPSPIKTSDGYIWKYLYTIGTGDAVKFISQSYIPVKHLTIDDGSDQWQVQENAIPGEIVRVDVIEGGSNYVQNTGTVVTATSNTITLNGAASSVNNAYQGYTVYILTGTGQGELKTITSYDGTTKIATISSSWTVSPTNTSTYIVSPAFILSGDAETDNFKAYVEVSNGAISKVNILDRGAGFTEASGAVLIGGAGATFNVQMSPKDGIGANPVRDLFAHNVTISAKFQSSESGYIITNNDFRIVGIIANPLLLNGSKADSVLYDNTTKLTISSVGTFDVDETIVGSTSGATARVVKYNSSNVLVITNIHGVFEIGENITGSTSGNIGYISNLVASLLKQRTGDVLYVRNQEPVRRSFSQTEDFKVTIKF